MAGPIAAFAGALLAAVWATGCSDSGTSAKTAAGGSGGALGGAGAGGATGGAGGAMAGAGGAMAGAGGGMAGAAGAAVLTSDEMTLARGLSPLPATPPADTTDSVADMPAAAALGQRFFFERGFSGALVTGDDGSNGGLGPVGAVGRVACASCHSSAAMDDNRSNPNNVSLGVDFVTRNAPPLVNSSYYTWTNWAGRFSAQWELPVAVVENPKNMGGNRLAVAHLIFNKYRTDYEALFGAMDPAIGTDATRFPPSGKPKASGAADGPWEMMAAADQQTVNVILSRFGKVLEAYVRELVGGPSPFDSFIAGTTTLTDQQVRGLKVFLGPGRCVACHSGPLFSDNQFHNLGLPQTGPHVPASDPGRSADITSLLGSAFNSAGVYSDDPNTGRLTGLVTPPPASTNGQFRTASLRNVAVTAPYMHAGQLATLEDVVGYYNVVAGQVPVVGTLDPLLQNLNLTSQQMDDLVAFLQSLTATNVSAALRVDTSAP